VSTRERTLTLNFVLENEDRDHPGTPFREVFFERLSRALTKENFKVGSGEYEVTIHRRGSRPRVEGVTLDTPLQDLGLPARILNAMYNIEVETIGELLAVPPKFLLFTNGLGPVGRGQLRAELARYGFTMAPESKIEPWSAVHNEISYQEWRAQVEAKRQAKEAAKKT
jgi:hypothetical protein